MQIPRVRKFPRYCGVGHAGRTGLPHTVAGWSTSRNEADKAWCGPACSATKHCPAMACVEHRRRSLARPGKDWPASSRDPRVAVPHHRTPSAHQQRPQTPPPTAGGQAGRVKKKPHGMTCPTLPIASAAAAELDRLCPLPGKSSSPRAPPPSRSRLNRVPPTRPTTTDSAAKHAGCGNFPFAPFDHKRRNISAPSCPASRREKQLPRARLVPHSQQRAGRCPGGLGGEEMPDLGVVISPHLIGWRPEIGPPLPAFRSRRQKQTEWLSLRRDRYASLSPCEVEAADDQHYPPPRYWPCSSHQTRPFLYWKWAEINKVGARGD
jgi:hypothetical protein